MVNRKLLGERLREFQKLHDVSLRSYRKVKMEFRTMDIDINMVRPELMKLQWEKKQYTRYITTLVSRLSPHFCFYFSLFYVKPHSKLIQLGWTHEQVTQRVEEKAIFESESIYGTLYGTLGESDRWAWLCGCAFLVENFNLLTLPSFSPFPSTPSFHLSFLSGSDLPLPLPTSLHSSSSPLSPVQ